MMAGKAQILERGTVRWQFVGNDRVRDEALFLQQFAHQSKCSLLVPAGLDQDIKYLSFAIHRPPLDLPGFSGKKFTRSSPLRSQLLLVICIRVRSAGGWIVEAIDASANAGFGARSFLSARLSDASPVELGRAVSDF